MLTIKQRYFQFLLIVFLSLSVFTGVEAQSFISPSLKQYESIHYQELEKALKSRHISLNNFSFFEEIAKSEKTGFLGYHGDSLDFYIYQDIIRFAMHEIVGVSIRHDFHFLAVPLDPTLNIQTKRELPKVFNEKENPYLDLFDTTFALNFSIWDNVNRFGINSIENFSKNESFKPLGYRRRLKWFFNRLGMDEKKIETLFSLAHSKLKSSTGVILQVFDQSTAPYAFSKRIAYPAYPNGFITENRTVDEIFLDESYVPPFPHEIRLLLNNRETLNPNNQLMMERHTLGISYSTIKSYESALINEIKKLTYSRSKKDSYRKELLNAWGMSS